MTLLEAAAPAPTATGPTARSAARSLRGPAVVVAAVVLAGLVVAALTATGRGGQLDPDSYAPAGSRAVAEVLRDQGVRVVRAATLPDVTAATEGGSDPATVVVPFPQALAESELRALAELDVELVVVGADQSSLDLLDLPVEAGEPVPVEQRQPACALLAAERAGTADVGGLTYSAEGVASVGCYASSSRAALLTLPSLAVTLLGSGDPLTNDRLGRRGNAALALGLLGSEGDVVWFVPAAGRDVPDGEQPSLGDLVPEALKKGALWLLLTAGVLALWRARRLGPVVEEPLPVVVRASEAVEGRGRLYRAAGARGTAAESLRAAARERLARRVSLPTSADRGAVVVTVAERTGSSPADVDALLYGGPPADDAALVRLADDLRILETALTREVAGP